MNYTFKKLVNSDVSVDDYNSAVHYIVDFIGLGDKRATPERISELLDKVYVTNHPNPAGDVICYSQTAGFLIYFKF